MKLGKEEIQKIVLGGIGIVGVIYVYFEFLLGPLAAGRVATAKQMEELSPKIAAAKTQIRRAQETEQKAPASNLTLKQLTALIPDGAPVAWFPPQVEEFFTRKGIEKSTVHLNSEAPEKELTGFRRITWGVDLPHVDFVPLGAALADFENEHLLAEIGSLQIETLRQEPESEHAILTINSLVKQ